MTDLLPDVDEEEVPHRWGYRVVYEGGDGAMATYWTDSAVDAERIRMERGGYVHGPLGSQFWGPPPSDHRPVEGEIRYVQTVEGVPSYEIFVFLEGRFQFAGFAHRSKSRWRAATVDDVELAGGLRSRKEAAGLVSRKFR